MLSVKLPLQPPIGGAPFSISRVGERLVRGASFGDGLSQVHHRHDFYMLYWTVRGTSHHLINYRSYEMKPGRVFFILAGQVHQVSRYAPDGWLILLDKMLYQDFISQNGLAGETGLFDRCSLQPYADLDETTLACFHTEREKELRVIKHYLSVLLLQANKQYGDGKAALFFHPNAVTIRKLKQLIEQHYKTKKLTAFYASKMGLPSRKLNDSMMQVTGKLAMALVAERTLAEAEIFLASTGIAIKDIAYELGFNDQAHFATWFRKYKGTNPKGFRLVSQT